MKYRFVSLILFCFVVAASHSAHSAMRPVLVCKKPNSAAFFINGVLTEQANAEVALNRLAEGLREDIFVPGSREHQKPVSLLYNYSVNARADFYEASILEMYNEKYIEKEHGLKVDAGKIDYRGVAPSTIAQIRAERLAKRLAAINENWKQSESCFREGRSRSSEEIMNECLHDPRFQIEIIERELNSGKTVTLIGYSEGSIFVELYRGFLSEHPGSVFNVLVGSPIDHSATLQTQSIRIADDRDPVATLANEGGLMGIDFAATLGQYGDKYHLFENYMTNHRADLLGAVAAQNYQPVARSNQKRFGHLRGERIALAAFDFFAGEPLPIQQQWPISLNDDYVENRFGPIWHGESSKQCLERSQTQFRKVQFGDDRSVCARDYGLYCQDLATFPASFIDGENDAPNTDVTLRIRTDEGVSPMVILTASRKSQTLCAQSEERWGWGGFKECGTKSRSRIYTFRGLEINQRDYYVPTAGFSEKHDAIEARFKIEDSDDAVSVLFDFDLKHIERSNEIIN